MRTVLELTADEEARIAKYAGKTWPEVCADLAREMDAKRKAEAEAKRAALAAKAA